MAAWEFQTLQNIADRNGWHKFISMQNYYNLIYREEEREMVTPSSPPPSSSLFPLLYTAAEFPVKTVYTIFWLVLFLIAFDRLAPAYVTCPFFRVSANIQ